MSKFISAEEYCIKVFDGTHDTPKPLDSGFPLVTSKHIVGRNLDFSTAYFISENDYNSIQKRSAVSQWDVLFSMIGSVGEVYLEKNSIIPYAIKNIGVFSCGDEFKAKWLYYFLQSPHAITHIKRYLNGAVQKFLPLGALRNFPIFEFNKNSKIITKVLSDLDTKIELNNRINRELEAMAKTLYDYWFVQFDFPNEQGKPYKSSGGKMVYNAELKREIPEEWEVKLLGSEIEIQRGISYTSNEINGEGIPMINLNSFNLDGTYKSEGVKSYSGKYTEKNKLKSGDLLIAATDVTRNADIIGRAILVPDYYSEDLVFSMDIAKIISSNIPSSFLMMLFNSSHYHNYIKWYATGTLVLHLNLDGVNRYKTEIPSNYLLKMFDKFYLPIANRIYLTNKQNQQLSELRDWLLPMLMNGQVTVKEAEERLSMAAEPSVEYKKRVKELLRMNINSVEITNVKGIGNRLFQLDLQPNKPNILVAPNGFGKSSFALAFDRLKRDKIELGDREYFNKLTTNRPELRITLSNSSVLIADDNQNTINEIFDVVVINNQTEPKSVVQTIPGRPAFAKTTLDIITTTLIQTIPPKVEFAYNSATIKTNFGTNGNIILTNITNLFKSGKLLSTIEEQIDFSRFGLKSFNSLIESAIQQINNTKGSGKQVKAWIADNLLEAFKAHEEFSILASIIHSFGFDILIDEVDYYLTAWQIITVKDEMGADFKKACKYQYFLDKKQHYTETIANYNPVKDRFDIKPKVEGNSLVVNWPKAHELSNGERDIITFIALLLKTRNTFKKRDCILVIDEIFDYMDDGNLITFQYYISTFIEEMKSQKRRIFPILLTHLDPLFFNHFCFNDNKIKVCYIKDIKVKSNQNILNIIYNRENEIIKNVVDANYFHFHPNSETVDLTKEFKDLNLNSDWGTPPKFFKMVFREVRRYLLENDTFDPLAICFGVRIQIEQLVYNKISDFENKRKFIEENNGTKNKLHFAQSIGVILPETYFLLGIIYNTSLHLSQGQDISKPLGLKLENETIKQMIMNLWN